MIVFTALTFYFIELVFFHAEECSSSSSFNSGRNEKGLLPPRDENFFGATSAVHTQSISIPWCWPERVCVVAVGSNPGMSAAVCGFFFFQLCCGNRLALRNFRVVSVTLTSVNRRTNSHENDYVQFRSCIQTGGSTNTQHTLATLSLYYT